MTIKQKLQTIQKILGLTQTKLAERFGVSFVALNNWLTEKSKPRPKAQTAIDELYLEVTGQKSIPLKQLNAKKESLKQRAKKYKSIIKEILDNPDIKDQFILKLTYHSNHIEGSTLSEKETAAVIFDNIALPNKTLTEQLEAKNHQTALIYLFDYIQREEYINEKLIIKLHAILMNGVRSDAGVYRNQAVRIVGVNLPTANYLSLPKIMPKIIRLAAEETNDIISQSTEIHKKFEQTHPFSDGNGRIGRLLLTAMLLKNNLAPAIIRQEQKQLYYTFLYKAQAKDDNSQLEDFFCDAIVEGFDILERKI
jgi:Fic family protein